MREHLGIPTPTGSALASVAGKHVRDVLCDSEERDAASYSYLIIEFSDESTIGIGVDVMERRGAEFNVITLELPDNRARHNRWPGGPNVLWATASRIALVIRGEVISSIAVDSEDDYFVTEEFESDFLVDRAVIFRFESGRL